MSIRLPNDNDIVYIKTTFRDAQRISELIERDNNNRKEARRKAMIKIKEKAERDGKEPRHRNKLVPDIEVLDILKNLSIDNPE